MASSTEERNIAFKHTLDVLHERTDRQWFEESFGTRHAVVGPEIWRNRPFYNDAAGSITAGLAVAEVDFELTLDPFSAGTTWFAKTNPGVWPYNGPLTDFTQLGLERVQNWISPVVFGPSSATGFTYLLKQGDGTPIPTGNWELRFTEGILHLSEGSTAVDKGWVTPLKLTAYRYPGPFGFGSTTTQPIVHHTPVAGTESLNWVDGPIHEVDLGSAIQDIPLAFLNPEEGAIYRILVTQGATPKTVDFPGNIVWVDSGGSAPDPSTVEDSVTLYSLLYDGTDYVGWAKVPAPPTNTSRAVCIPTNVVGDLVYARAPETGGVYQVGKVDPRDDTKMPAIGMIVQKQTASECWVQYFGEVRDVYTGLATNESLFVGADGKLTPTPPTPLAGGYAFVQAMGTAIGADTLLFTPSPTMFKRVG